MNILIASRTISIQDTVLTRRDQLDRLIKVLEVNAGIIWDDMVNVILIETGEKKIEVIKEIRAAMNSTLKDSKDLAESPGPRMIVTSIPRAEGEKIAASFRLAGATVEIRNAP